MTAAQCSEQPGPRGATMARGLSMEEHPLQDGDGLVENLYAYLWAKNSQGCACPGVRLPQTVVYRDRSPGSWFFFSKKEQSIMRKKATNLVGSTIAEAFARAPDEHTCAGTLLFPEEAEATGGSMGAWRVAAGGTTVAAHMSAPEMRQWVLKAQKPAVGVLQAWVEPRELSNSVIRANWSPQVCLLERRTNQHPLSAVKVDLSQRLVTFEGPEHCSHSTQIAGSVLPDAIREVCNNIVEHILDVSSGEYRISRMVLNFKVDRSQQLQLLYCSSLRLEGSGLDFDAPARPPANMSPPMLALPSAAPAATTAEEAGAGVAVSPPRQGRPASGTLRPPPATASRSERRTFVCVLDGRLHDAAERSQTTFKSLLLLAHRRAEAAGKAAHASGGVPASIQRADPILSGEKFQRVCNTHEFLYRTAPVCLECSRVLNAVAKDAIAAEEDAMAAEAAAGAAEADAAYMAAWGCHAAAAAQQPRTLPPPPSAEGRPASPRRASSARAPSGGRRREADARRPSSAAPEAPPYWRGGAELPWRRRDAASSKEDRAEVDDEAVSVVIPSALLPAKGHAARVPPAPSAAQHSALEVALSEEQSWTASRSVISGLAEDGLHSACHDIPEGDEGGGSALGSPQVRSPNRPAAAHARDGAPRMRSDSSEDADSEDEVQWAAPDDPVVTAIRRRFPEGAGPGAVEAWVAAKGIRVPSAGGKPSQTRAELRELLAHAAHLMGFAPDGSPLQPPAARPPDARARRRVSSAVAPPRERSSAEWRRRNALSENGSADAYDALGIRDDDDDDDDDFLAGLEQEWEAATASGGCAGQKPAGARPRSARPTSAAVPRKSKPGSRGTAPPSRVPLAARNPPPSAKPRSSQAKDEQVDSAPEPPSHPKRQDQLRAIYAPQSTAQHKARHSSACRSSAGRDGAQDAGFYGPEAYCHTHLTKGDAGEAAASARRASLGDDSGASATIGSPGEYIHSIPVGAVAESARGAEREPHVSSELASGAARLTMEEHALLCEMIDAPTPRR
eukprot:jgi/Tetstr1/456293/TSEL_043050.t1